MAARAAAEAVAEGAEATDLARRCTKNRATHRARAPETGCLARDALPPGTTQRIAFTSAGVTLAGWPPHVARR